MYTRGFLGEWEMILQRIAKGIKDQDWFVVMIVVVGIFIGLQVDDWNEKRLDDAKSEIFTSRLIADLREEVFIFSYVTAYNEDVLHNAVSTLRVLTNKSEISNEEFLINAYRASQYTWWSKTQTTLEELISTGQLDLIKDSQLLSTALAVYRSPQLERIENKGRNSPYRERFRSLIPMDIHRSLRKHCGDISILLGEYEKLDKSLSFECELGLPQSTIDIAANALKGDPKLISALRQRVATLDSQVMDLHEDSDLTAMLDYFKTRSDP